MPVTVRFFAAARAAAGRDAVTVGVSDGATLGDVVVEVTGAPTGEVLREVLANCSFLVNGYAETDRSAAVGDGDEIDVLPPFAGG